MKNFWKKFWQFLKEPPILFTVLSLLSTVAFSAVSLVAVFTDNTTAWWVYPIYALAAVSLFFATFAVIYVSKNFRKTFQSVVGRYAFTERLATDKAFRLKLSSVAALAFGIVYTLFLAVMAVLESSFWYASLAEYNLVFVITRSFVLEGGRRAEKYEPAICQKKKAKLHALCGGLIILVGVQFLFSVLGIVFRGETFRYVGIMIYVFAMITFYRATMAIVRIVKIGKQKDLTLRSVICYNLASASVSIVALQTAMFQSFEAGAEINIPVFNAITGGTVCLFLLVLGVVVLVGGVKTYKQLENVYNE